MKLHLIILLIITSVVLSSSKKGHKNKNKNIKSDEIDLGEEIDELEEEPKKNNEKEKAQRKKQYKINENNNKYSFKRDSETANPKEEITLKVEAIEIPVIKEVEAIEIPVIKEPQKVIEIPIEKIIPIVKAIEIPVIKEPQKVIEVPIEEIIPKVETIEIPVIKEPQKVIANPKEEIIPKVETIEIPVIKEPQKVIEVPVKDNNSDNKINKESNYVEQIIKPNEEEEEEKDKNIKNMQLESTSINTNTQEIISVPEIEKEKEEILPGSNTIQPPVQESDPKPEEYINRATPDNIVNSNEVIHKLNEELSRSVASQQINNEKVEETNKNIIKIDEVINDKDNVTSQTIIKEKEVIKSTLMNEELKNIPLIENQVLSENKNTTHEHTNSPDHIQNSKFYELFDKDNKILIYLNIFLINISILHKLVKEYIRYPYDLLIFFFIGYFLAKFFSMLKRKSKPVVPVDDSDTIVQNVERRFKDLTSTLTKSLDSIKNSSIIPNNNSINPEEKNKIENKLNASVYKIISIKEELINEISSCNKTLDEICETQINILKNLQ